MSNYLDGPSTRAQVITRRTYNRPTNDEGTAFESWTDTVDRVIGHQRWLWERAKDAELETHEETELNELRQLMLDRKATVSGRTLWLGGTDVAKKRMASQFNCSFLRIETVSDIADAFWLLLQGCGVGFEAIPGILNGFPNKIDVEVIPSKRTGRGGCEFNVETVTKKGVWTIKVGDSAAAWAKVPAKILANKSKAHKLIIDFSEVRPAGERLKGYGWISSGYEGLARALVAICNIMNRKKGEILNRIDILDILNWLGTTLSSRRSAEISVVPWGDPEAENFAMAKKNYFVENVQRAQSNNSLLFYHRPTKYELLYIFNMMEKSGGSEPGFINAEAAYRRAPWFKGINPCLTGDTLIPVNGRGFVRIADLDGQTVKVRDGNGDIVSAKFEKTASQAKLLSVELSDGSIYRVTPTHNFICEGGAVVPACDLMEGEPLKTSNVIGMFGTNHDPNRAYIDAWLIADGTWYGNNRASKLYLYGPKHKWRGSLEEAGAVFSQNQSKEGAMITYFAKIPYWDKSKIPDYVLQSDRETVVSYLKGAFRSDGHIGHTIKGWTIQYSSVYRSYLQDLQALLKLFGVRSRIAIMHEARSTLMPDGNGGRAEYDCQACWRLTISNPGAFFEFYDPSINKRKPYNIPDKIFVSEILELEEREDVYCCGVETTSSFDLPTVHSGNCAEILLGNKSFCNLVEVDLAKFNGKGLDLLEAIRIISRANYRQTCVDLRDEILQTSWHELNLFLRLCGVGMTGIVRWEHQNNSAVIRRLRKTAQEGAHSMADELGLPRAKAVCTVKPSGTLSKIFDTTEGAHKPLGRYMINNVNFSKHDPVIPILAQAGYKVFNNPLDDANVLVAFPVCYEDVEFDFVDGKAVNIESAVAQLERYKLWLDNYADHNVSVTISYSPNEVNEIVEWLMENWSHYIGVSFLYRNDPTKTAADLGYLYLPQEVVTEDVYNEYVSRLLPINLEDANSFDEIIGDDCATGACPIR